VVMWQVRTESSRKKAEYYIWSIRFGSYDTGGEMTAPSKKKILEGEEHKTDKYGKTIPP